MKKKILSLMIGAFVILLAFPISLRAEVKAENFQDTITDEIEVFKGEETYAQGVEALRNADLSNYKESEDKVNVYVFRGSSCSYCFSSIVYFTTILEEYGKYFNLVTYEVWENKDNENLMNNVADVLGDEVTGVPYIVIGDTSFPGYAESMNSDIEKTIKDQYNSKEKYDVMENLDNPSETTSGGVGLVTLTLFLVVALFVYVLIVNGKTKKEIKALKEEVKKIHKK